MSLKEAADAAYTIAVEECRAPDDPMIRQQFIDYITDGQPHNKEFRCCQGLGTGGKLRYNDHRGFYVNYYPEDKTTERETMKNRANERLTRLNKQLPTLT